MNAKDSGKKNLYLIDGSGYIFRAFFGMPAMYRKDGTPTNAVYGFCNMVFNLIEKKSPHSVAVIFDKARKTFRSDIYSDYKKNRSDPPDELIPQFDIIRRACKAYNVPYVEKEGFEADDIIATYAKNASDEGYDVVIVSSDKDLMQLVSDDSENNVYMYDPVKNKKINEKGVFEKFGVYPSKVIDVQALAGDSADNIPGVRGIGVKTGSALINEFGSLKNLLNNLESIKQLKKREKLIEDKDLALMSKKLVTLRNDVKLNVSVKELKRKKINNEVFIEFLREYELNSLIKRVNNNDKNYNSKNYNDHKNIDLENKTNAQNNENYQKIKKFECVQDEISLKKWVEKAKSNNIVAINIKTSGLNILNDKIVGFSMSVNVGDGCYVPVYHNDGNNDDMLNVDSKEIEKVDCKKSMEALKSLMEDPSIKKIFHNAKFGLAFLKKEGINFESVEDTMLMSFVLNAGKHENNMEELAKVYLNYDSIKYKDVVGTGKKELSFAEVDLDKLTEYAGESASLTRALYDVLLKKLVLKRDLLVYSSIELPLISVIMEMEKNGFELDVDYLHNFSNELKKRLINLKSEIFKLSGEIFNILSPKQLGNILFEKLAIPGSKKTASGTFSTSADVLEKLKDKHPIVGKVSEYKILNKLISTYADALPKQISKTTNKVHTSFNMVGAQTGRLSSSNPNLQNIPIRTNDGKKIRKAFVTSANKSIVSMDYSQVELRIIAEISNAKKMLEAFKNDVDIHKSTAANVYNISVDDVNNEIRYKAKAINFGIIYGVSAFSLAEQIGVSRTEAKELIDNYFNEYPEIKKYMQEQKSLVSSNGYVKTLFSRKINLPGIFSKNRMVRSHAERQAINAPIQGSAADIIKIAMVNIYYELEKIEYAKLLLQVHDELVFEVENRNLEFFINKIKPIMENAGKNTIGLNVDLKVDAGYGNNWEEAH